MILERVLELLAQRKVASPDEIARALNSSPDAARSMLQTLQRKGLVHRIQAQAACGSSCNQCMQGSVEIYASGPAPVQAVDLGDCPGRVAS
jgi:Fe2+ or Zn2+ uptake regulation protein